MPVKVFFHWNGLPVSSDVRDICLPGDMDYNVYHWIKSMNYTASIYIKLGDRSIWRIVNDQERMMFRLKWAPDEN
jgi:hypothetical protein